MNNQQIVDAATTASLFNFLVQYNHNVNNMNFNYGGLDWKKPQDRISMTLDACVADELHTRMLLSQTVTLRNLWHFMDLEMGVDDDDMNHRSIDESLCRIANEFGFPRNRLPVTTHCARSITISNNYVTLDYNHMDQGWVNFPLNFPATTLLPQDFDMRLWTEVQTNAQFQILIEADGIVNELTQNYMNSYFKDYIMIDSGGYGSHSFRTLACLISRSLHPKTKKKIPSVCLGDQDGFGVDLMLVTMGGVLDPRRVQNQTTHLVENLQPISAGDLRNKPNTMPLDKTDERGLRIAEKRLAMIAQTMPHIDLQPWRRWSTNMRNFGHKISAVLIPNLVGFIYHHPVMANLQRLPLGTLPPTPPVGNWY